MPFFENFAPPGLRASYATDLYKQHQAETGKKNKQKLRSNPEAELLAIMSK